MFEYVCVCLMFVYVYVCLCTIVHVRVEKHDDCIEFSCECMRVHMCANRRLHADLYTCMRAPKRGRALQKARAC